MEQIEQHLFACVLRFSKLNRRSVGSTSSSETNSVKESNAIKGKRDSFKKIFCKYSLIFRHIFNMKIRR